MKEEKETVYVKYAPMEMKREIGVFVYDSVEEGKKAWPQERWENEGMPHVFCKVESSEDGYEVQLDGAYGSLRLLYKGEAIAVGRNMISGIIGHEIVVLDREYYGVSKYIWR